MVFVRVLFVHGLDGSVVGRTDVPNGVVDDDGGVGTARIEMLRFEVV